MKSAVAAKNHIDIIYFKILHTFFFPLHFYEVVLFSSLLFSSLFCYFFFAQFTYVCIICIGSLL